MELLVQGAMVERFERKRVDVKHRLNDLVDDLFDFMLSEVSALAVPPLPTKVVSKSTSSGGITINLIPSKMTISNASSNSSSSIIQNVLRSTGGQPTPTVVVQQNNQNNNNNNNNNLYQQYLQVQPTKKTYNPQHASKVQLSPEVTVHEIKEEIEDEEDEMNEQSEANHQHHHQNVVPSQSSQQISSSFGNDNNHIPTPSCSNALTSHHNNCPSTTSNSNGYCCDSDSEFCQCYECMVDESMVKVEMAEDNDNDEGDRDDEQSNNSMDMEAMISDGLELPFHYRKKKKSKHSKAKRPRLEDSPDAACSSSSNGMMIGEGGSSQQGGDDQDEDEGENVPNNHQIETMALKCWFNGCHMMLEDRAKLNQHLFFEHNKTLPYHCRVVGCGRQFEVR